MKELSGEISSQAVAERVEAQVLQDARSYAQRTGFEPVLYVISTDSTHDGSRRYVNVKRSIGNKLGINVEIIETADLHQLEDTIDEANADEHVNGVMMQLPTHPDLQDRTEDLLNRISKEKDVDGLGEGGIFVPATSLACDELLLGYNIDGSNEATVLIGMGKLSNEGLKKLWGRRGAGANLVCLDVETPELERIEAINNAKVIVTATGRPGIITPELFEPDTKPKIVVDVGTAGTAKPKDASQNGDVSDDFRKFVAENPGWYVTPVVGGVGRLTVRMLMKNVMTAANSQLRQQNNDRDFNPFYIPVAVGTATSFSV